MPLTMDPPKLLRSEGFILLPAAPLTSTFAQILLENKAKVNLADIYGETPLFEAAHEGHLDIVEVSVSTASTATLPFAFREDNRLFE